MRDVGDPELVRPHRDKLAIYQVSRTSQGIVTYICKSVCPCIDPAWTCMDWPNKFGPASQPSNSFDRSR
jgi:hypothetical protein